MRPSVLAALFFRLVAVWWALKTLPSLAWPVVFGVLHLYGKAMPGVSALEFFRSSGDLGGLGALAVMFGLCSLGAAVLLFIWSAPLGRLTARGLE